MEFVGNALTSILAMLVTLGILVTIHEYGHYSIARLCGVKVERFSIGFGKPVFRWLGKRPPQTIAQSPEHPGSAIVNSPTEYVIGMLPLGGYVKMLGEQDEVPENARHLAFNSKPLFQRAAIVAAGPIANFLLAIVLYWLMFMGGVSGLAPVIGEVSDNGPAAQAGIRHGDEIVMVDEIPTDTWQDVRIALLERLGETGNLNLRLRNFVDGDEHNATIRINAWLSDTSEPDLLGTLGLTPFHMFLEPRIEEVLAGSPAERAGIRQGDLIVGSNGRALNSWMQWLDVVRSSPEQNLLIQVDREEAGMRQTLELNLIPGIRLAADGQPELDDAGNIQGYIGAAVHLPQLPPWMNRTVNYGPITAIPQAFAELKNNTVFLLDSIGKMLFGQISVKNLSGPITIAQVAGETASSGLEYYINFLAILSISLGVLNLLPVPVLDGGHLLYYGIEAVIRRPVPRRIQELGMQVGMLLVTCMMFLALFNDVNRLF